ncbi:MAG: ATP-dependent sacrificial sulfur transferase LarE [Firmicutes bacterium]|nr:ATP-dependent sacrificial sulfur transferase LarE [Bacillota bacterium]
MFLNRKYNRLKSILKELERVVIAYSGGVDSNLLAKVSYDLLKENAMAITVFGPMHTEKEINESIELAKNIGIKHKVIKLNGDEIEVFKHNPKDRCYLCKKKVFKGIIDEALEFGTKNVLDGSNLDDLNDYRPGMKAINELGVLSPLKEAEFSKEDIRILSNKLNLPTWNKPAAPCLATRIPYGSEITKEKLRMIEKGEELIRDLGFKEVRVRHHGNLARIEVSSGEIIKFFKNNLLNKVVKEFKLIGFKYVTLDLEGYKMGKMNDIVKGE